MPGLDGFIAYDSGDGTFEYDDDSAYGQKLDPLLDMLNISQPIPQ